MMVGEIGEEGQRRLRESRVLIVGLGGLGSVVAPYLNGAGVGTLGLMDHDVVSLSNLHRQLMYTEEATGRPKAGETAAYLAARSSDTRLETYDAPLTPENAEGIIACYDVVIDCTDNYATRYLIDDVCARLGKRWIHGAIGEWTGQVTIFGGRSGGRYSDLYPDRETLCALPRTTRGVTGPVAGVIGAIQAVEAIKLLVGIHTPLDGQLLVIDLLNLHNSQFTIHNS